MRTKIFILVATLFFALTCFGKEHGSPAAEGPTVDVASILFGHIGDSYGWHITDWKGEHISIPLPCIVRSSTGCSAEAGSTAAVPAGTAAVPSDAAGDPDQYSGFLKE